MSWFSLKTQVFGSGTASETSLFFNKNENWKIVKQSYRFNNKRFINSNQFLRY
jgi:hypothetical protein